MFYGRNILNKYINVAQLYFQIPNLFDDNIILRQLRYTGMLETVRIRRAGYSVRIEYEVGQQIFPDASVCETTNHSSHDKQISTENKQNENYT